MKSRVSKKRSRSKIKRVLNELSYYNKALADTEDLFLDYDIELNEVLEDITSIVETKKSEKNSEESSLESFDEKNNQSNSSDKNQELDFSNEKKASPDDWMKKLFKKIAIETHPDKLSSREDLSLIEKIERESIYKKCAAAIEKNDKFSLLESAIILEIELQIAESEQIEIVSSRIKEIKKSLEDVQSKVAWIWGENEGNIGVRTQLLIYVREILNLPQVSDELIEKYVIEFESGRDLSEFLKQFKMKKQVSTSEVRKVGTHPGPPLSKLRKS